MKKISNILLALLFASFLLTSCDGLLKVDSSRYVFEDEYGMKSTNDSLYAMFGVFTQLEKLADEYVLLGELRGDLMDVTPTSNPWLKEINDFDVTAENPYADKKQYYAVINNCNYIIKNIDTTIVKKNEKVMYKVLAATKAIRAWTYMQLALNYKTVVYYKDPILSLEDANKTYQTMEFNQLADSLIMDIAPYKDYAKPSFGSLYSARISDQFFPIRFLLGDLYLWTGRYEQAANEYHDLMFINRYTIHSIPPTNTTPGDVFKSYWDVTNGVFNGYGYLNWTRCFSVGSTEIITNIAASNEFGNEFMVDSLAKDYQITASKFAITNWDSQRYMHSATLDTLADLRKIESVLADFTTGSNFYSGRNPTVFTKNYLAKLYFMNTNRLVNKRIMPYRVGLLYLRYAEAVNRLGKVHLAMAVLKYGLTPANLLNPNIVPTSELDSIIPNYMNFTDSRFVDNIAIRARTLGKPELDGMYVIPASLDSVAKINYMEDLICNELALETAFEGNRFHDLMRFAIRRDDTNYLAAKVAAKHPNNPNILNTLQNRDNWYLK
jgi:starch-binding outer membrane protein, SusD/RagB family